MLLFCVLHISASESNYGPMIYWLVVAAICAFIAYGRFVLRPFQSCENERIIEPAGR